ncbi:bifunctional phosphopantothenoylcysteine decarboxylase/phosphopantothenate synthase [mine drainage metagenome]|uniref:Bifunctional phosphopantothenoylcysteine decarboxylase/phosphopantothenate synthase n=1 Tax=mine drainage metagenome TaxID=410659 RepID=T1ASX0_9ZZZZ
MSETRPRRILLGVSGGIAAYKSVELVRRLTERGFDVQVVMTKGATRFIAPLTFQAVSGHPVREDLWDEASEAGMGHLALARWADLVLVAPASAHCIARLAHGLADDLLTTLCLATDAPLALAPAMNPHMWLHPATQANCAILKARGVRIWGPADGPEACGESGPGRLLEPPELATLAAEILSRRNPPCDLRVLITAGPTREPLDPVRYLSNRSSGRMGYALARAFHDEGAEVTLISGPTALRDPLGIRIERVETAQDMHDRVLQSLPGQDIFCAVAAVADFRPSHVATRKVSKDKTPKPLPLEATPDILMAVSGLDPRPFIVGFAAETHDLEAHARAKLAHKKPDLLVTNPVGPGQGFESEENEAWVFWPGGDRRIERMPKGPLAEILVGLIRERYAHRGD